MNVTVTLPNGSRREVLRGTTLMLVAEGIGGGLARAAVAGRVNGVLRDLSSPIESDAAVEIVTYREELGARIFRHTAAHIMAMAIKRLYPKAVLEDGPATDTGFFYDIEMPEPMGSEAFPAIEREMKKIVEADLPVLRRVLSRDEAIHLFTRRGERFKVETIEAIPEEEAVSVYEISDFADLCRGPHLPSTGAVRAFCVQSVAGAYRKGDASREQLQRFYGLAFPEKKMLRDYLALLEEAKKRDHRKIGQELDLFSFHEEGQGFPFFHPKGTVLYNELMQFIRAELAARDYLEIRTPLILDEDLWHRSGHWDHYRENMYFTQIDGKTFAIKPMNCPGGLLVYRNALHSYKELPMRVAEFGLVHRHELSGVLHGLFRVRCFTQDDAHVFCTPEQMKDEVVKIIELILHVYKTVGFEDFAIELSTRPEKSIGTDEMWEHAMKVLESALAECRIKYNLNPGEGVFYGPKIDFHIKDCLNRTWQCGTIQADFSMPERFDLTYIGPDGERHRPVMVHRAIFGSIERFLGVLIEHCAGRFPLWLTPVQARVLTLSQEQEDYARQVAAQLCAAGLRVEIDSRDEKIGHKIREAEILKTPVMLVVGKKEAANAEVSVRRHGRGDLGAMPLAQCIAQLVEEVNEKRPIA